MSKPVWWRGAVYAEEEEGSYLTNARFVQIHLPSNTVGKQFLSRHDATSSDYAQQKQKRMRRNMKTKQKFSFRREKFCLNHLDQKQVSGMSKNHAKNERERATPKSETLHPPPTAIAVKSLRRGRETWWLRAEEVWQQSARCVSLQIWCYLWNKKLFCDMSKWNWARCAHNANQLICRQ